MTAAGASRAAVVAACMARGLIPEQTEVVMDYLESQPIPERAIDIQRQLEDVIKRAKEGGVWR